MTATAKRKRHLISEFALLQTLSRLFHLVYFVTCIKVQENKKESCCLVFSSSTKREFGHFHVVYAQQRQRNVQNMRGARGKLLFC